MLLITGPGSISETHEVGGNICPQVLGSLTLRNDGQTSLSIEITGVAPWMRINAGPAGSNVSGTLAPGESRDFLIDFSCDGFGAFPSPGNPTDVQTTLMIGTSTPDATGGGQVNVALRVQDEE